MGYGGLLLYQKPQEVNRAFYSCISAIAAYTFYFTNKIFSQVQVEVLGPRNLALKGYPIQISQISIGIGYLVSDLENLLRKKIQND